MSKIIVLMGAPGAGKGTQARLLQERLNLPQISTGDIFRALRNAQTPLAQEVRAIMAAGQLVPDELTIRLVRERTALEDCQHGYVLDGFPRTPAQAASLEKLAQEQGQQIIPVLIDLPEDLLIKRTTGRRTCPVCGEIYNDYSRPPKNDNRCDLHPEAELVRRADDNAETVRARLDAYNEQTLPLLDYYRASGLLRTVEGSREPGAIYKDIERIVRTEKCGLDDYREVQT
jgi:adenylate kinase